MTGRRLAGRPLLWLLLILIASGVTATGLAFRSLVTELAVSSAPDAVILTVNAIVKDIIADMKRRGEAVPVDAFGHPRLDKVNVGQYVGKRFGVPDRKKKSCAALVYHCHVAAIVAGDCGKPHAHPLGDGKARGFGARGAIDV